MASRGMGDYIGTKEGFTKYHMDFSAMKSGVKSWDDYLNQGFKTEARTERELSKYDTSQIYSGFMSSQQKLSQEGYTTDSIFGRNITDIYNKNVLNEKSELSKSLGDIQEKYDTLSSSIKKQASEMADVSRNVSRSALNYLETLTEGNLYDKYKNPLTLLAEEKGTTNLADVLLEGGFAELNKDGTFNYTDEGRLLFADILEDPAYQDYLRKTDLKLFDLTSENWEAIRGSLIGEETTTDIKNKVDIKNQNKYENEIKDKLDKDDNIVSVFDRNTKINDNVKSPIMGGKGTISGKTFDGKNVEYNVSTVNNLKSMHSNLERVFKENNYDNNTIFKYKGNSYIRLKGSGSFYKIESQRLGDKEDVLKI